MVVTIGTGSKSSHVTVNLTRTHEFDCTDWKSTHRYKGPTSSQPERVEKHGSIESVMEIDGVRISADSIKSGGNDSKLSGFTCTCTTINTQATFSFIYRSDVFPIEKELRFYWPKEIYIDGDGRRWTKNDLLSFSRLERIREDEATISIY